MADLLGELDKQAEKEGTGGGIIGQFRFEAGYKVFAKGLGNLESFFAYVPGDEKSQAGALAKAKEVATKYGVTSAPQTAAQLVVFKNSVKGKDVTWKDDRFFTYPVWTDAYKKGLKPKLQELKIDHFGDYWGKIGFIPDPSGRKRKNQNGEDVVDLIAIPVELYSDEQAAIKASHKDALAAGAGAAPSIPQGYTADTWAKQKDDIGKLRLVYIQKGLGGDEALNKVAADYGATAEQVAALLGLTLAQAESLPF